MTHRWEDRERLERCHLQRRHRHCDGDERPLMHSFDAFVGKLEYVQEEVHLVERNLDVEIVQENYQRPALGMKRNIMVIFLLTIVKMIT